MGVPSKGKVLLLYRQLLKQGKVLQYTDYDFFRRSVRREFEQQKDEVEIKVIKEQFEVFKVDVGGSRVMILPFLRGCNMFMCSMIKMCQQNRNRDQ